MSFSVAFSCKAVGLGHGEVTKIVGNTPSLGKNEISRAITLHTTQESYPYYETSVALPINATSFNTTAAQHSLQPHLLRIIT